MGPLKQGKVMLHHLSLSKCYICDKALRTWNTITLVKITLNAVGVLFLKSCLLSYYFSNLSICFSSHHYNICLYGFSSFSEHSIFTWKSMEIIILNTLECKFFINIIRSRSNYRIYQNTSTCGLKLGGTAYLNWSSLLIYLIRDGIIFS